MARELRLVLTQKCLQNCLYCHREGLSGEEKELLNPSDYRFIFKAVKEVIGIDRVTITGGEPLLRKDIGEIIKLLKIEGAKIKLITNGILIYKNINIIPYLEDISISLTTLDSKNHRKIHRSSGLTKILRGINNLNKIKAKTRVRLNVCCVKGINDNKQTIKNLINFAQKHGLVIRFIELLNSPKNLFMPIEKIIKILDSLGLQLIGESKERKLYKNEKGVFVELQRCPCRNVELTSDIGYFCKLKNDIFITPDGKIKPCMLKNGGRIDILDIVKNRDYQLLIVCCRQAIEQFGVSCPKIKL